MEDRLCLHAVSNLRNSAWQAVRKGGRKPLSPLSLLPHFLKMAFPDLCFFLTLLFFSQVQMLLSNKERATRYSFEGSQESCIWLITVRQMWRACFLFPQRDEQKERIYILGKGRTKNFGLWDWGILISEEVLKYYEEWSIFGSLWLTWARCPLAPWRHVSYDARILVPAFAAIATEVPLRPWWGLSVLQPWLWMKSLLLWPEWSSLAES